jgi:L-malate glycosyltransferase
MKTILFLAPANSIHSWRWINFFKEKGFRILWVSLHAYDERMFTEYPNIKPKCFYKSSIFLINITLALRYISTNRSKEKINIVHSHSVAAYGFLGLLTRIRPFVATTWGSDVLVAGKSFPFSVFVKRVLKTADLITTDAQHMAKEISYFGVKQSKVNIINFGIDTSIFNKAEMPSLKYRDLFKNNNDPFNVISLRNHYKVYDIRTIIKSIPIVVQQVENARFIIAGAGPESENLENLARSLNVGNKIVFLGRYNGEELPDIFSAVDIYISASLSDAGISASTAEAMACCTPVVVSDTGENNLWIKNRNNGILFEAGDYEALAAIIIDLYKNPSERIRIGEKGREIIVENNDYFGEMSKMSDLYSHILEKNFSND